MTYSQERIEAAIALAEDAVRLSRQRYVYGGDNYTTLKQRYLDTTVREMCAAADDDDDDNAMLDRHIEAPKYALTIARLHDLWHWRVELAGAASHPLPGEFHGFCATRAAALSAARAVAEVLLGVRL